MNINPELERLANIFNLEIIPAEINGDEALALADIKDPDTIFYGPVYDNELVNQQMVLDYLKVRLDELETGDWKQLNLWDPEILGEYSDGYWEILYRMAGILSVIDDLHGVNVDTIGGAAADEVLSALGEIVDEIAGDLE